MESQVVIELLRHISENTATNDSLWIAAVAGGSAVLGAAISGVLSYFAARSAANSQALTVRAQTDLELRKLRASLVTTERLRWLQDLRLKVAEFYANIEKQLIYIRRVSRNETHGVLIDNVDSISDEVRLRSNVLRMVLDSEVEEQRLLADSLDEALHFINQCLVNLAAETALPDREELRQVKALSLRHMEIIGRKCWLKVQGLE